MEAPTPTPVPDSPVALSGAMANTLSELIESITALDRMQASLAAHKAELIDQARQWSLVSETALSSDPAETAATRPGRQPWDAETRARRVLISELACALRLPERTTENLIMDSADLLASLPGTHAALAAGKITWRHTQIIVDHARSVPLEARPTFEETLLGEAAELTPTKLSRRARVLRETLHPESIDTRHTIAVESRRVELSPAEDGMAWVVALLPATQAHGIFTRVCDLARNKQHAGETRTITQLRADAFSELLLDGVTPDGVGAGIRPTVLITVPVMTLLGHSTEPAMLEGYGPIDLATARDLTANAPSLTRLLTHPETGAVLSVGRDRYSVPTDLRLWLRLRDETCRFPGCDRPARTADIDHTHDWADGGDTCHDNLAHLCHLHHQLKHQTGWTVTQLGHGILKWTSPTGKTYLTHPTTRLKPPPGPPASPGSTGAGPEPPTDEPPPEHRPPPPTPNASDESR